MGQKAHLLFYLLVFLQIGQFELSYCGNTVGHPVPMLKNALDSNDSSLPVTYNQNRKFFRSEMKSFYD